MKKLKWFVSGLLLLLAIGIAGVRIVAVFGEFKKTQKQVDDVKGAVEGAKKDAEESRQAADKSRRAGKGTP